MKITQERRNLLVAGSVVGIIAGLLVLLGNPKNMGFCIACFVRDTAGAFKLHGAPVVQYLRPEIIGLVLGALVISLAKGEFRPRGGSSPVIRFVLGFFMMVGALVFLGCPLRMVLRLAGGDLNAIIGLLGFASGVFVGCLFLKKGYSLGRSYSAPRLEGYAFSAIQVAALVVLVCFPFLLSFSEKGPGSMHAPLLVSLLSGLVVGILAQRTRMCMAGGIRDIFLFKDSTLITGPLFIFLFALLGNLLRGTFTLGFVGQPIAHHDFVWNFLGMALCGLAAVMLGGCPLRQLILAGEGNSDSAMACLGMLVGAAFSHNWSMAGVADAADKAGGATLHTKVAVLVGLVVLVAIGLIQIKKKGSAK